MIAACKFSVKYFTFLLNVSNDTSQTCQRIIDITYDIMQKVMR